MSKPARRRPSLFIERLEDRINPVLIGLEAADVPVSVSAGVDGAGEVAVRPDGSGFVVAYQTDDASGGGVWFKRYDANWQLVQGPVAVNTFTTNEQQEPSVAYDAAGNFVIAYQSFGQDPGDTTAQSGIYARRYNASGTAIDAAEFRVNTTTLSQQRTPDVGVNAAGQFTIVYRSGVSVNTVFAQSYASTTGALTTVGGELTVKLGDGGSNNATVPSIAVDAAGNFAVTYQLNGLDGDSFGIYAQRLSPTGTVLTAEFLVNTVTAGNQQFPDIAMDGSGNFNIVWHSDNVDGSGTAIVMQRYNASAAAQGGNITVNTGITTGNQTLPHIAANAGGTFLVMWDGEEADGDAIGADAYYKLFNSAGTPLTADTTINLTTVSDDQTQAGVYGGINTAGDFVVAFSAAAGANFDVYLRRYAEAPIVQFASTGSSPNESIGTSNFTVGRIAASYVLANVATTVSVTRTGGTATPGTDFTTSFPISVTINAGSSVQSAGVAITNDTLDEANETIDQGIAASANYTIGGTSARTITIVDDDPAPTISVSSPTVTEGNSGTTTLTYTISLNTASGLAVTGNYATGTGSATAGTDYVVIGSTPFTIGAGSTSTTVSVTVNGDTLFEINESVPLNLTGVTNTSNATASGLGIINNDDTAPSISVSSPTVTEGDSGSVNLTFTLSLSAVSGADVTGDLTPSGSASAVTDYTGLGLVFTIPAGSMSTTVVASVLGDALFEGIETLILTLSNLTGTSNAIASGTGTIADNDAPSTIAVVSGNNQTATVGTAFGAPLVAEVRNAGGTLVEGVTVNFTGPGAGASFTPSPTSGTTNASGQASSGTLTANATAGGPYTVSAAAVGGSAPTVNFSLTNQPAISLSINDVTLAEGNSGTTTFTFTVSLSGAAGAGGVTFDIATANGTATTADADYVSGSATGVNIPAGLTSATVNVTVNGDTKFEANETFVVNVTNVVGAGVADGQGQGTINNDDTAPTLSIGSVTANEGNSGTSLLTFTVTQSAVSGLTTTVNFATANGTAVAGVDYVANSGTLTFAPGETTKTVAVTLNGDVVFEAAETFTVTLSGPTNATLTGGPATGTINNDDTAPTLAINDVSVSEAAGTITFTVTRTGLTELPAGATFTTADGTAVSSGSLPGQPDFTAATGTVTVAASAGLTATQTFNITLTNDAVYELASEGFVVNLTAATNATFSDNQGAGTITNDDAAPVFTVNDFTVAENGTAAFTVTLTGASALAANVTYATADGSALSTGSGPGVPDFTSTSGTLSFGASTTTPRTLTVTVPLTNDTIYEQDETFVLNLSGATGGATIGDPQGVATITDDEPLPAISIDDVTVTEGNTGTTTATFTVTMSAPSGSTTTVNYATANDTALAGSDFTTATGAVTFPAGVTSRTISVLVTGDTVFEANQSFFVNLSGAGGASIADAQGVGTITNDDAAPTLAVNDVTASEATGSITFTVTRTGATELPASATYTTADGTAVSTAGGPGTPDFTAATGTVTVAASLAATATQTFSITLTNDAVYEAAEQFLVNLTAPGNASISDPQGVGTLTNDDAAPSLSINDFTVSESGTATFTVTLTGATALPIAVNYATADGTAVATAGGPGTPDYTATTGTLNFAASASATQTLTVTVPLTNDTTNEPTEQFVLNLSGATNGATISDTQGVATVTDDDAGPALSINDVTVTEGTSGTTTATFTVTLAAASAQTVTVNYATADGTALAGTDYTAASGTLTFAPGVLTQTFAVLVTGDTIFEANQTFLVNLSAPTNASIGDPQGVGTITNDDAAPTLAVNDVTASEATGTLTFTVTRTGATELPASATYTTADGTAVSSAGGPGTPDFTAATGTVTVAASLAATATQTFSITLTNDAVYEAAEQFLVNLTAPGNASISDPQGVGTLTNDDAAPSLSINDFTVSESGTATFTVTLTGATALPIAVNYATADGTAVASSGGPGTPDYTATTGTLNFAASASATQTLTVTVPLTNDTTNEAAEQFVLNLSGATNGATISDTQGVATITNDDAVPSLAITDASTAEGNAGSTNVLFTVSLSAASAQTVTVAFATADGTALAGTDYTAASGTLTFAPGVTTQTVTVLATGDTVFEADQSFFVNLSAPTNAVIGDNQGVGTITNDDAAPTLTINDVTASEAAGTLTFTVTRTGATELPASATYTTADGTAVSTAGGPGTPDFTATSNTVTVAASLATTATQTFSITLTNDAVYEAVEQFFANLSSPTNASIADPQGLATISNDDAAPSLSINDFTVAEDGTATFTVTLTGATALPIAVDYATADGTAVSAGSATPGTPDYTTTTGTLTFSPSASVTQTLTVTVPLENDTTAEDTEQFVLNLSNASNGATISDAQGVATVTNDDAAPTVSVGDVTLAEGDTGTTNFTFTLTLSAASGQTVTVNYTTADGTAAGTDYAAASGTVTFAPGETTQTVTVLVTGDGVFEADEAFTLTLTGGTNVNPGAQLDGTGTITNDDAAPTLTIDDVTVAEAVGTLTFTVTRTGATELDATVDYATADASAVSTGTDPGQPDFTAAAGTVTIAASLAPTATQTFTVALTDDNVYEAIKQFFAELSNATNATIADPQGLATIMNDDAPPSVSVGDITVSEDGTATFTLTLTGATGLPIAVDYATADGTAVSAGSATPGTPDYTATTGTITFAPSVAGTQTLTVTVPLENDTTAEDTEQFVLNLSNSSNGATISDTQGVATVTDDDPLPTVSVGDATLAEGDTGTTAFTFTVTLSAASGQTVTVNYTTADGTAAGTDYAAASGTVTFAPGVLTQTVTVLVTGDGVFEADEAFTLNLSAPTNVTIDDGEGLGTITNDDAAPTLTIDDVTVAEAVGTLTFTVTRTGATELDATVDYATADASAVSAGTDPGQPDFTAAAGTVTIAASLAPTATQTFTVSLADDNVYEAIKQFFAELSNATNATIADPTGLATIMNDDAPPSVSVGDITVGEDGTATFTLTLTGATGLPIAVDYATADGTAVSAGSATPGTPDYTASTGTITFAPSAAGTQTLTLTVPLTNDTTNEADEQFVLNLSNASNGATISDTQGVATITNDDPVPSLSVTDVSLAEGNSGTTAFTFTVSLSAASAQTVTVNYATADGTAAGTDYAAAGGTLTFAPGVTTQTVTVLVTGETVFELDQTFTLNLSAPTNATVADGEGLGTITNDDAAPTLAISSPSAAEGAGTITFTVTRTGATEVPITVNYATADATATAGSDYSAATGSVTIAPALTPTATQTFTVTLTGDTADELDETFTATLSGAAGATIATGTGTATIQDDDLPVAAADAGTVAEDGVLAGPTVLGNDNAAPGSVAEVVTTTASGTLALSPDGTFTYTPAANFNGTDSFTYRVRNTAGELSAAATVTITVTAVNDAPVFTKGPDQTVGRSPGAESVPAWATAISAGPADEAAQALTFLVTVTGTTGTLAFDAAPAVDPATGALTFTPTATTFGTATVSVRLQDSGGGTDTSAVQTFTITVTRKSTADDAAVDQIDFAQFAAGGGAGSGAVTVFNPNGSVASSAVPFGTGVGVRAVLADVTGDGVADVVAGTTAGVPGRLLVTDGVTGKPVLSAFPFEAAFTGGLFVAAGDLNADGRAELIVSPDGGGGGRVVIYDGATGQVVASFLGIDDKDFRGGARVAVGDVNGDGVTDLVVTAGFLGGPRVAVFDGTSLTGGTPKKLINDFFAFEQTLRDGVYAAVGDLNNDGFGDLIFGGGPGGGARVLAQDGKSLFGPGATGQFVPVTNFLAGDAGLRAGVQVAAKDADGDGRADLVTAVQSPKGTELRLYLGKDLGKDGGPFTTDLDPYPGLLSGVYVG